MDNNKPIVALRNIDVTFQQKEKIITAVNNVSLSVNPGEIVGIIGYSGAGKSTLVRTINLLQQPTNGTVIVDGMALSENGKQQVSEKQLTKARQNIGMIFQQFNLFDESTVKQNILFALRHSELSKKEQSKRVEELLSLVDIEEQADKYPSQLSGGQKQRVSIARALANNPKILLSDESTSALDPKTTEQVLQLLKKINKELGVSIILITHEMSVVQDLADRVFVMQNGQIIEEESTQQIFSNPKKALTKDFVDSVIGSDKALSIIKQQPIYKNLAKDELIIELKYTSNATDTPVLDTLHDSFHLSTNILFGNIERINDGTFGVLILKLSGTKQNINKSIEFLEENKIALKKIKEGEK